MVPASLFQWFVDVIRIDFGGRIVGIRVKPKEPVGNPVRWVLRAPHSQIEGRTLYDIEP